MADINDIIDVTITRETSATEQASFSTILFLSKNTTITTRYKKYGASELSTFASELTGGVAAPEYKAVSAALAQNPRVPAFAIGKRVAAVEDYDCATALNAIADESDDFFGIILADDGLGTAIITFNGDLVTGNKINGGITGVPFGEVTFATDHATTMGLIVTSISLLTDFTASLTAAREITVTSTTKVVIPIITITEGVGTPTTTIITGNHFDRLDIAGWCETNKKYFFTQSYEDDIVDTPTEGDTFSLAYQLGSYDWTMLFYRTNALFLEFIDAAFAGKVLPYLNDVDAGNWHGANLFLAGITPDRLSVSKRTNAHNKKCNTYEKRGGKNITREGWSCSGEYADIIMWSAWQEAKIIELNLALKVNKLKIPFTDAGISEEVSKLHEALTMGKNNGGISPDAFDPDTNERTGGYEITYPLASAVSSNDKANKLLQNVKAVAFLSGAINKTKFNVNLVL
jgi:hypothetical protein